MSQNYTDSTSLNVEDKGKTITIRGIDKLSNGEYRCEPAWKATQLEYKVKGLIETLNSYKFQLKEGGSLPDYLGPLALCFETLFNSGLGDTLIDKLKEDLL